MGAAIRHYVFPDDAPPVRVFERVIQGLIRGNDTLPQFAGTRQRVLTVFIEMEGKTPINIYKAEGSIWAFDDAGDITESLQQGLSLVFASLDYGHPDSGDEKVVSIDKKLKRKKLQEDHRWTPTDAEMEIIVKDIWAKKRQDRLQVIKGTAKPRVPMTWDAEDALRECSSQFYKFSLAITALKEPSLKAFEYEARRRAKEHDHSQLYNAIADIAAQELEIIRARKKNKGVWYASVDIIRWKDGGADNVATFTERCESRKAAEEAARKLLVENAQHLYADTTVEASIVTEAEWKRDGGPVED